MDMKSCCFLGSFKKTFSKSEIENAKIRLTEKIELALMSGYLHFISGAHTDMELFCAEEILNLKKKYFSQNISLELSVPYLSQFQSWDDSKKIIYFKIIELADKCSYFSKEYTPICFLKQDKYIIDNSSLLITTHSQAMEPTYIAYAKATGCCCFLV